MAYLSKADQVKSFKPKKKRKNSKPISDGKTPTPSGNKVCQCGCGNTKYLTIHHVFFGNGKRRLSNRFKCVEWLCHNSHQGPNGIHGSKNPNISLDYKLKCKHQKRLMDNGMTINEFRKHFDSNYIGMGFDGYYQYRMKGLTNETNY